MDLDPDPSFHFDADPDLTFLVDTDPFRLFYSDADPDPTFHSDADPVRILFLVRRICEHWSTDLNFDLDADPDPDPAFPYTHVLHHDEGRITLASHSILNIDIEHLQVCVFTVKQDRSRRGHHYGKT